MFSQFSQYYHTELGFIRELARIFAVANPSTEGILGERGADPDVERLLQGFAFLAAGLRERIDDNLPELIHGMCELILPDHLSSLPSCSIVELTPELTSLRGRKRIEAGTELLSKPIEGTACRFRTTSSVDVLPLVVDDVALEAPRGSSPVLRLRLHASMVAEHGIFQPEGIRLFLHGELAVATTLWHWLLRYCREVRVRSLSRDGPAVVLPGGSIVPVGLKREHALLPWAVDAPDGPRLLQEYFTLPQKFLFVDLQGLDRVNAAAVGQRFEVAFHFDKPPQMPGLIDKNSLRLNCVPVINLFSTKADPIAIDLAENKHLLRAAGAPARHAEVHSVDAVRGKGTAKSLGPPYVPFFSLDHALRVQARQPQYRIRRELSITVDGVDTYLSVVTGPDAAPIPKDELLAVDLTCTNGLLAGRLQAGDIHQALPAFQVACNNLLPATAPILPDLNGEHYWLLIGQLKSGSDAFESADQLRSLLELYDFGASRGAERGRPKRRCAEAIHSVLTGKVRGIVDGDAMLGRGMSVELQEEGFASHGEAFLFGSILNELFVSSVTMNSFVDLMVRLLPSKSILAWKPTRGTYPVV